MGIYRKKTMVLGKKIGACEFLFVWTLDTLGVRSSGTKSL